MVARPGSLQASFNSGELSPEMYARTDVKQFYAGAARMVNVEPVPQGGFRLLDRSRDCGPERGGLQVLPASQYLGTGTVPAGTTVAQIGLAGLQPVAMLRLNYLASIDADARLLVQYQDAGGAWQPMATIALRKARQDRAVGRPPGAPVLAQTIRLVLGPGADAGVTVTALAAYAETAELQAVQYAPWTYNAATAYVLVLLGNGLADVYRDGVWVGAAWHDGTSAEISATQLLQRLDTGLLFHPARSPRRLLRLSGGDHEWNLDTVAFDHLPQVDLGGSYVKVAEVHSVVIRWPTATAGAPSGYVLTVTVDGEETNATGIPAPLDWNAVATDLQAKLLQLDTVQPGVTVSPDPSTPAGSKFLIVTFGGANAGSQFTLSARIVNNAEGGATTTRITKGDPGGESLFSPARGYAATGTFYQDRLFQGGFAAKPGALLASPTGDYYSGNVEVEAATGGILLNLDTDGAEQIVRMARSKHLVIFTSDAEYYIADRNVQRTQPTNVVESTRNGCARTVPVCATETGLLYVSRARSLVYAAAYDDQQQAYVADPISLLARHLITGISGAALQRADDRSDAARYHLVRDDGVLVLGLLIRSQDVTAFVQWATDGKVRAVAVDGANRVTLSVERLIGGVWRRRVERIEPGLLVDGAISFAYGSPQSVVAGLALHEGATVWAQADGIWLGPFTVQGGGITLPIAASAVTVGRWSPPVATTLPLPRDIGGRQVLKRPARVFAVSLRLIASTSLAIGANGRPADAVPLYEAGMPVDGPQPPVSRDVLLEGLEGFSDEGQVTITQTRPGALQVGALTVSART